MTIKKLFPEAEAWLQKNPQKTLIRWIIPGKDQEFVYKGDFYHKGVDLSAQEVLNIQTDHVFTDAVEWTTSWNKNPDNPYVRMAGIEYIGPVQNEWWEDKGKNSDPPFGDGKRWHKFGGAGTAYILTYP